MEENNKDIKISEMMEMQKELWKKIKKIGLQWKQNMAETFYYG